MEPRSAAVLEVRPEIRPETHEHGAEPPEKARRLRPGLVLLALFAFAALTHGLASLAHLTPAIFTDELLHSKLAQSFAEGNPFSIRGERFLFPAPLPALVQAPAWLFGSVPVGYEVAKIMNAVVMSLVVFPAYLLARQFTRQSWALIAAGTTVLAPASIYHDYLLSEALGFPVFFLAASVLVQALRQPSRRWALAVIGVSLLAVATRTQFALLPAAFALAAAVGGRRTLRPNALPLAFFAVLAGIVLATRGAALGPYANAQNLDYGVGSVLGWATATGVLLPFAAGLVVVPGAVLGLVLLVRSRADRAAGVFLVTVGVLVLLAAGFIAAGDAERPLGRYAFYLPPLAIVLFFAYAERGAPWRRAYAALAVVLGLGAWAIPYSTLADAQFAFDSPTLSAYAATADSLGHANASTIFAGAALLAAALVITVRARASVAPLLGLAAAVPLLFLTSMAYVGDHRMTERADRAWSAEPADWIDEIGVDRADFLVLPYAPPYFAWTAEAWNRSFGRPLRLGVETPRMDTFAAGRPSVGADGVLRVDGEPLEAGVLVVNDYGTRIDLEGETVAQPRGGLRAVLVPDAPRVRSLAAGVYYDGWMAPRLRLSVWPGDVAGGQYVIGLELPEGMPAREFTVRVGAETRLLRLGSGERTELVIPVEGGTAVPDLMLTSNGGEILDGSTANPRIVAARVLELRFEPDAIGVSS